MIQPPPMPKAGIEKFTRFSNPAVFSGSCQRANPLAPLVPTPSAEIEVGPHTSGVRVLIVPLIPPPAASKAQFNWVFETSVRVNVGAIAPAQAGWANHAVIIATINVGDSLKDGVVVFIGSAGSRRPSLRKKRTPCQA